MPKESKFKIIFYSKITLFLLLMIFIWLSVNLVTVFYKKYKINREIEELKSQAEKLEKDNQEISGLIEYFNSENFLEKEAKEKLNLRKEGEEVVIIEQPKELATASEAVMPDNKIQQEEKNNLASISEGVAEKSDSQKNSPVLPESNFIKWWKYFFH